MQNIKVGVIGVGHLGKLHAAVYQKIPQVQLVGVYDQNPDKGKEVASQLGVECFSSPEALLEQIQAVSVATSTSCHFQVAAQSLEKGIHVLVEKPVCHKSQEAEELTNLAEKKKLILQVGHIERFNPAVTSLNKIEPHLDPLFIEVHRLAAFKGRGTDVAVVLDLMTHDLDLILSWVDSPLVEIQAAGVSVVTDSDDIANARLTFANGCVANLTASRVSTKGMRKIRIFQKDLYVSLDLAEKSLEVYRLLDKEHDDAFDKSKRAGFQVPLEEGGKAILYQKPQLENQDMLTLELSAFADSAITGKPPLVDGRAGAKVLQTAIKIQGSIDRHRAWAGR